MSFEPANLLAQLQPHSQLFQAFVEKSEVIFWVADPVSFQLVYVSPQAHKALGLPLAEWVRPLFWQNHLYSADRERVLSGFETAVTSQVAHQFEYRLIAADGTLLWFWDTVCLLDTENEPLLCGMMVDVTAHKTAVHPQTSTSGYAGTLLDILTLLSGNLEINQRLNQLAEKLCRLFDLTAVNILSWDPNWGVVTPLAQYHTELKLLLSADGASHASSELGEGMRWLATDQPVLSNSDDTALSEWERAHLQKYGAKTILYVPLLGSDGLMGCIEFIESRAPRTFTKNDIELSQIVAQQTTNAIAKAQLFQAEARRRREAEILLDVAEFVSSSLDRDEVLDRVMEILRVYLSDVHNCAISLISKDEAHLETILSWWADDAYALFPKGGQISISDTFTGQLVLEGGEPIVISDLEQIPFANERTATMLKKGLRAVLCVPLKIQNRPIGTLHIHYWNQPRQFSVEEVAIVQGVANQAAIAIENARLFANERRQLHLSKTLQKVGELLTTSLQLEEVYEQIFDLLSQVVSYNSSSLFLFDKTNEQFVLTASRGFGQAFLDSRDFTLPSSTVLEQIPASPGWRVIQDVRAVSSWLDLIGEDIIRGWIGAFLVVKGEMLGVLCVDSALPGRYSDEDGRMLAAFANQAAVAIENARLYDETVRQAKELSILNQVSQETAVSFDIDAFLEKITQMVVADIYPHVFGFIMYDAAREELIPHPSFYGVPGELKQHVLPLTQGIVGNVILTSQPHVAPNVHLDPYYDLVLPDTQSEVTVPLKVNSKVIGVINVESPEVNAFSNRDVDFLMTLAGNIAAVMERAKLYETLRIQAEGLAEQVALRTSELKMERDRLFAILESAGEGIILTDTEAHILYVNPAMVRQSGYSRTELKLQNPRILGSKQVPKTTFTQMWQNLLSGEPWVGELINRHRDGHVYDVAVTVTPIADAEGEVTGYVSVQADITRLKELERLKTEFIANVSHQLRTPLTNIKTYVSLLSKGKPEKFPHYFSVLHHEIDRLARLIQDLLDISRLDAEAPPGPDTAADFCDFWEMFWPPFRERAERENRTLQISLPDDVSAKNPFVFMASYELEKILARLVENSLAYSDEGGVIKVAVDWQDSDILEIKVCDDGPGIPEAERPFIFDRFFRGTQALEAGLPGNGLGLAIVKELLARYGGSISLESEVGVGSCFTLHLPLAHQSTSDLADDSQ